MTDGIQQGVTQQAHALVYLQIYKHLFKDGNKPLVDRLKQQMFISFWYFFFVSVKAHDIGYKNIEYINVIIIILIVAIVVVVVIEYIYIYMYKIFGSNKDWQCGNK